MSLYIKDKNKSLVSRFIPFLLLMVFIHPVSYCNKNYELTDGPADTVRKTMPYTLPWDDMPIDLSFIYKDEKPAGKHGFMTVEGDRFVFEDGTEGRFWGTNFNSAQNFPPHDQSEKVSKRLAKIGVNIVRFHQMDAEWSTPNIFRFTKGDNKPNTMSFDPESMDRLDYLIYCLKQEGIYVFMDLLTYRRFKSGDGVEAADQLGDAAKPYSIYNRRLIELQKKFIYDLWTHINPYTKLMYKDDPSIALTAIVNENELISQSRNISLEPYRLELENLYRKWADNKGIKVIEGKVFFNKPDKTMLQFLVEVQQEYYREMIRYMRETGVRIPVNGTFNWGGAHLSSQMVTDFTNCNVYWGQYSLWHLKKFQNESMTGGVNNLTTRLAFNKVAGKPFFITEWDNPWPNEWRAESSLLMAAVGSLQNWGGFCIHTYRYTLDENVGMIGHGFRGIPGKRTTSDAIGGNAHRGGVFDTFNDPAKFGLFYHAALIIRRGDVKPSVKTVNIKVDGLSAGREIKALQLAPEQQRVQMVLPGMTGEVDPVVNSDENIVDMNKEEVLSDTKELYRNLKKKSGWIDTPYTKAVYGFSGKEGGVKLTNMIISVKTDFATVAISSLTRDPISNSDNMLLTMVGRADNTGSQYNKDHTESLEVGHGPIQVEVIEATFEIETSVKNLRVMAINPQGFIIGYIPSQYKDGIFRFETGKEYQSMYYLIQDL